MGVLINGKPLVKASYNGLIIEDDCMSLKEVDFSNWEGGTFTITDTNDNEYEYNVELDAEDRITRIYDDDGQTDITITW